jgi:hypothetical protein
VYQSSWSVTGQEPPETATADPEEELTVPEEADRPDEVVELALDVEVEDVLVEDDVEPGMVAALT